MRLLNCTTKRLEEFVAAKAPEYAILSHTWSNDEVGFDDITKSTLGEVLEKESWKKINNFCDMAIKNKFQYVWADTVCIDKSSSAELSEAINSMFKWYRNAKVCYAYLYDLEDPDGQARGLEKCRWFTRGWTLQEMIASEELRFYDKNWVFQGTKTTLVESLRKITGVDTRALRGGNLRFFSVARKMSWAANRATTRVEDLAYCLLGIFDISLPLLYGEGSKAFIRLQEEIIKQYDDESLFAWRSDRTSDHIGDTSGLLAPSPSAFKDSADFAPCLTPDNKQSMSGPITVTSRGVRLKVPIEDIETSFAGSRWFRLNCKEVTFERKSGIRTGIIVIPVAKIEGYKSDVSMYTRVFPNILENRIPQAKAAQHKVYLLKENRLPDFDLASSDVFLIRTMPHWPETMDFHLAETRPPDAWDHNNDTFRRSSPLAHGEVKPFVLVFRRKSQVDEASDYFIIAMGRTINPEHVNEGYNGGSFWCNARYCPPQREGVTPASIDSQIEELSEDQDNKTSDVVGAGVQLKCHVRPEVMSGQQLFFVDLLVKADD